MANSLDNSVNPMPGVTGTALGPLVPVEPDLWPWVDASYLGGLPGASVVPAMLQWRSMRGWVIYTTTHESVAVQDAQRVSSSCQASSSRPVASNFRDPLMEDKVRCRGLR